jgi:hypothetical protein
VNKRSYLYRTSGRVLTIRMLDLSELNTNFVTLDMLWLSLKVIDNPLISFVSESVVQYSQILKHAFFDVLTFLISLNKADFNRFPSIEGYLAAKSKKLVLMGLMGNPDAAVPPFYQRLQPSFKDKLTCHRKSVLPKLKSIFRDFEISYRGFEKELISDILKKGLNK